MGANLLEGINNAIRNPFVQTGVDSTVGGGVLGAGLMNRKNQRVM